MNKIAAIFLSLISFAASAGMQHENLNLVLSDAYRDAGCPIVMKNKAVNIDYSYDFERKYGLAHILRMDNLRFERNLYPLGLSDYEAFMSDMAPQTVRIGGQKVTVYRVIFHIYRDGTKAAAIMFGKTGSCVLTSRGFHL